MARLFILMCFMVYGASAQVSININTTTLTNCLNSTNSSTQSCIHLAQQTLRSPQSCYQARAAKIALTGTFIVTTVIAGLTFFIIPIVTGLIPYLSNKCSCCKDTVLQKIVIPNPSDPPHVIDANLHPGQAIFSKMFVNLGAALGGIVNFATFSSLYSSWQSWTSSDANCRFDSYDPISTVGDLSNDGG